MKMFALAILAAFTMMIFQPHFAFSQEPVSTPVVVADPDAPTGTTDEFLDQATAVFKDVKAKKEDPNAGKTAVLFAIILGLAQLLIQSTKTRIFGSIYAKVGHAGKLAIVSVATLIITAIPMLQAGVGLPAVLASGAILSALMVAAHQVWLAISPKPAAK